MPDHTKFKQQNIEYLNIIRFLRSELLKIWILGLIVLITSYFLLGLSWQKAPTNQWFLQSAVIWGLIYYLTSCRLELNRLKLDSDMYPNLGWANRLTILRGGLIAMTGGFIFLTLPSGILAWVPGVFYTVAAIIDRIDGYVARKTKQQSLLGTELDTVFDALGLVLAPLLAVGLGKIHWSYLLVSSAYYLFQLGISYRHRYGLPVYVLPPTLSRRAIAGIQMGFIAVVLWPVFESPATTIAGFVFMIPVLTGFIIDWFIVSGRIDRDSNAVTELFGNLHLISEMIIQPMLRILIGILSFIIMTRANYSLITEQISIDASPLIVSVMILTVGMILLGILGRLSSIVLVTLLGLHYLYAPIGFLEIVLLVSVIWVISFGTGRFSLWQWDEHWFNRYDGA